MASHARILFTALLALSCFSLGYAQSAFLEASGQVVIEAENFTAAIAGTGTAASKTWNSNTTSGASGTARQALTNSGVSTADTLNGPRLDYTVKFATTGTYYIWVRLRGGAAADNSIHAGLNAAAVTLGSAGMSTGTTYNSWVWKKTKENNNAVSVSVSAAGYATVNIWMREDGVIIDKIILTTSSTFTPSGTGPAQSARETDTTAPSVPAGLTSANLTATSLTLNWTASTDNVAVTGYEVFRDSTSIGTPTANTFAVTGLTASTAYNFTVRARDAAGNWSAQSAALSVTTLPPPDITAPSVPTGLAAANLAATSLTLNWTASTDAVGVTGYEVFRGTTSIGTPVTNSFAVTGLTASTAYSFKVRARDAAGNWSAQSAALSITTTAPPAVAALTFNPGAGSYTVIQNVTIATTTSGATIRYTTNGSNPTATSGTIYTGPITISTTTTLKAIAYLPGYNNSPVASATFTITLPKAATPTFLETTPSANALKSVLISSATPDAVIAYTTDGTTPTFSNGAVANGLLYTGTVDLNRTTTLKAVARANGYSTGNVASKTFTFNLETLATPLIIPTAGSYRAGQSVAIMAPPNSYSSSPPFPAIAYTIDGTSPATNGNSITNGLLYSGPITLASSITVKAIQFRLGFSPSNVAQAVYTIVPNTANAPTFNPVAGTFADPQNVSLGTVTAGAVIRYTTDGSTPTLDYGAIYSGPVSVGATTLIKAIAYKEGEFAASDVSRALYEISASPAATIDVLHDFSPLQGGGTNPLSGMMRAHNGDYYGATQFGGCHDKGTIFKLSGTGQFTTVGSFLGFNGANPQSELLQMPDGSIYGSTYYGGTFDHGTIFKLTTSGILSALYSFSGPEGANPISGLILGPDGNFYGTTRNGALAIQDLGKGGSFFRLSPQGYLTSLGLGGNTLPAWPVGDLRLSNDAHAYGITDDDAAYKISLTGRVALIIGFSTPTSYPQYPTGGLEWGLDGNLYGVTLGGGDTLQGSVYKITDNGGPARLVSFDGSNGQYPHARLSVGMNGNLYGSTNGALFDLPSTLFKVTPSGAITSLVTFNVRNGDQPWAPLLPVSSGQYLGTTSTGGLYNAGVLFRLRIPTTPSPNFIPAPESTVPQVGQSVSIAIASPYAGAQVYYTLDGSLPTSASGNLYTSPITLTGNVTLRALAVAPGLDESDIVVANYVVVPQVASLVSTIPSGTYSGPQTITLSTTTPGAVIYYTTNGTTPSPSNGTLYSGPITLTASTTFTAIAYADGYAASSPLSGSFTINQPPTVVLTAPVANFTSPVSAAITLTANASDIDGTISKVEFFADNLKIGEDTTAPYSLVWVPSGPGRYNFTAVAVDNRNAYTLSSGTDVNVLPVLPYNAYFSESQGYFTGNLHDQLYWTVPQGTASISKVGTYPETYKLNLVPSSPTTRIEQTFSANDLKTVFVDIYAKPVADPVLAGATTIDLDIARIAFVKNGTTGQFQALDGDGIGTGIWKSIPSAVALNPDNSPQILQHLTVRLDYAAQTYDVYINGRLIAYDLKFRLNSVTHFSGLTISGHATTAVEIRQINVGSTNLLFSDLDNDGIDDAWERANGLNTSLDDRLADRNQNGLSNIADYALQIAPHILDPATITITPLLTAQGRLIPINTLVIRVTDSSGKPLKNKEILIESLGNGNELYNENAERLSSRAIRLHTDHFGLAQTTVFSTYPSGSACASVSGKIVTFFYQLSSGDAVDTDGDGVSNDFEQIYGTNSALIDTDGDGLSDKLEIDKNINPIVHFDQDPDALVDKDFDGLSFGRELLLGISDLATDTDEDGLPDKYEYDHGLNAVYPDSSLDSDGDSADNLSEYTAGTDPGDFYNGSPPVIAILSNNGTGADANGELVVKVTNASGAPIPSAPVTFVAPTPSTRLITSPQSTIFYEQVKLIANGDGIIRLFVRQLPTQ